MHCWSLRTMGLENPGPHKGSGNKVLFLVLQNKKTSWGGNGYQVPMTISRREHGQWCQMLWWHVEYDDDWKEMIESDKGPLVTFERRVSMVKNKGWETEWDKSVITVYEEWAQRILTVDVAGQWREMGFSLSSNLPLHLHDLVCALYHLFSISGILFTSAAN